MADNQHQLPRRTNGLNAWWISLDGDRKSLIGKGRFRLLCLGAIILLLLLLQLFASWWAQHPLARIVLDHNPILLVTTCVLVLLLFWQIWRVLLLPLMRLCDWADLMRGVNLDARMTLPANSDFAQLGRDINMLANMIEQLAHDTETQLQKHTDHISRESRSLAILFDVASSINLSQDLNEVFERSLLSLCANLNASGGIIRQFLGKNTRDIVAAQGEIRPAFLERTDRYLHIPVDTGEAFAERNYRLDRLDRNTVFRDAANSGEQSLVLSVLLQYREEVLGAIHLFFEEDIGFDVEDYRDLLLSLGQHLGSAVEKFRLLEEEAELLVMQERSRLSHELHDSLAQTIASLRLQVRVFDEAFQADDEQSAHHQLERIEYTIDEANNQLRELITHFRAPINEQGLIAAIESAIHGLREETGISVYLQNEWPRQAFNADMELNLLRIVQESLANIRKHSDAERVRILLSHRDGSYGLMIEDDGVGFDEDSVVSEHGHHVGLKILRDRARQIDAEIDIESEPGDGTRIHLQFVDAPASMLRSTG